LKDPVTRANKSSATASPAADLWVFAYGSLMWRPGFDFIMQAPARVVGAHRALCVLSMHYRGTKEHPGLVLGLDRGGTCRGVAFRVAAAAREETIAYLREREQVTMVYRESMRSVWLNGDPQQRVEALCFVVDRAHAQYAGKLSFAEQLHYVRQGHGQAGPNRDYVINTVASLEAMGCRDATLHALAEALKGGQEPKIAPR
jgi:cation transport protein ChaC